MLCDPSTPEMPPEGHKSHLNHLKIRPESWRKLQTIHALRENPLERSICTWVDKYIPEESLGIEDEDQESGEMLSVPCPPTFDVPSQKLRRPADISRLSPWLDSILLMTTQRIMHIVFTSTLDWGFRPGNNNDGDKELFDYFLWTKKSFSPQEAPEVGYHSVLVAYQPPWILSPQDMKEFVSCRSVCRCRLFAQKVNPFKVLNAYGRSCGILVLQITADGFASQHTISWTSAFVTSVYNYDDYGPTVLEHLLYWVASATRLPGSSRIPQVPEPINSLGPQVVPQTTYADFSTPAPSESNWDGKSEDAGTSAGLSDMLTPHVSEVGLPDYQPRPFQTLNRSDSVATWIRSAQVNAIGFGDTSSPAFSNITIPNVTKQIPQFTGDWVMY
ncbi:hypothetical protein EYR40_000790 [Pleurotus pulmonarius]|nr:hypothetical protein EYR40_000790 [Pleurotus pulmonarius]